MVGGHEAKIGCEIEGMVEIGKSWHCYGRMELGVYDVLVLLTY